MRRMFVVDMGIKYEGFCYDGPHEGQWHESDESFLVLHAQEPLWKYSPYGGPMPDCMSNLHQIYYRWSDPLKKWVCLNMK